MAAAALVVAPAARAGRGPTSRRSSASTRSWSRPTRRCRRGSCTQAAAQIGARLKAAGYADADITYFSVPEHPKEGGLVAVLQGSDARAEADAAARHLDVVEAKREDWERDPFKLIEEGGYYYGRGTIDDKAQAAIWADTLIRFKQAGFKPQAHDQAGADLRRGNDLRVQRRRMAGQEQARPDRRRIRAQRRRRRAARREAASAQLLAMQVGEKAAQNYTFVATNPGGHSVAADARQRDLRARRRAEGGAGLRVPGQVHRHDARLLHRDRRRRCRRRRGDGDARACSPTRPTRRRTRSSAATRRCIRRCAPPASRRCSNAGHAENALPQRATANVNCRIFPGESVDGTLAKLQELAGPEGQGHRQPAGPPDRDARRRSTPRSSGRSRRWRRSISPACRCCRSMSTGATDGIFLEAIGIPVYGVPGTFIDTRHERHPRPERAHPGQLAVRRPRLPVRPGQGCSRRYEVRHPQRKLEVCPTRQPAIRKHASFRWHDGLAPAKGRTWFPFRSLDTSCPRCAQGALFWPARRALLVADLHFEKASWFASFGQMLPPYDSLATLGGPRPRWSRATGAAEIWCLGDSFHDVEGLRAAARRARRRCCAR